MGATQKSPFLNSPVSRGKSQPSSKPLAIRYTSTSDLKADPKNPRLHSNKQVRQIAQSIEAFGFNVPLLINKDQQVIAGHGRLAAAKLLKTNEVPTISLEHLTEAQARAFLIADNRLTENGEWDEGLLAQHFKELAEVDLDFSLEATGFEMAEIDLMIEGSAAAIDEKDDPADKVPETVNVPVSRAGDLWLLAKHRVFCGSSLHEAAFKQLTNKAASGDLAAVKMLLFLVSSAEERSVEAGEPQTATTDLDQRIVQNMLKRFQVDQKKGDKE